MTRFISLPKLIGYALLAPLALSFFFHPLVLVVAVLAFITVALFPWLNRFVIYTGPLASRPVWSATRRRTNVLMFWRLYRNMPGFSRATMSAMMLAAVKDRNRKA